MAEAPLPPAPVLNMLPRDRAIVVAVNTALAFAVALVDCCVYLRAVFVAVCCHLCHRRRPVRHHTRSRRPRRRPRCQPRHPRRRPRRRRHRRRRPHLRPRPCRRRRRRRCRLRPHYLCLLRRLS